MIVNDSNFPTKNDKKYCCKLCDYNTSKKTDYATHLSTDKHKNNENGSKSDKNGSDFPTKNDKAYECQCGKVYKYDSGFYRHKRKCIQIKENIVDDKDDKDDKNILINLLVTQNKELMDLIKNGISNTNINNTNSHNITTNNDNKTFNLNFFLNETCKDAMNINDFVSSIKVSLADLENTGRQGYIEGISSIILKRLNNLEEHFRPLHCSDSKREVFYIKDNNEWQKENEEKPILTKAIKVIANENIKQIKLWRDKYPDCTDADSKKNNLYLKIVSNSMNGSTVEESSKNIDKIISNVAKEVIIDKTHL
jgi:hypothetical protein